VADDSLSPEARAERGAWVGCVAGALSYREYHELLNAAGFSGVTVTTSHAATDGMDAVIIKARKADPPPA
jgi:hypothetical protein